MPLLPKFILWPALTLLEWLSGLFLFVGAFYLLAHLLPYWTPTSENPTQPFFQVVGWLLLIVMGALNALIFFARPTDRFLRQLVKALYVGIVLYLPVRELARAIYSVFTSDRLDWSTGQPVTRSSAEWLFGRLQVASEQYLVPAVALALALGIALVIQQRLGRWARRVPRMA